MARNEGDCGNTPERAGNGGGISDDCIGIVVRTVNPAYRASEFDFLPLGSEAERLGDSGRNVLTCSGCPKSLHSWE